jgi:hypothetical protein
VNSRSDSTEWMKTNLSYVLHEHSDSAAVSAAARRFRMFTSRRPGLLRDFIQLDEFELADRVIVDPRLQAALRPQSSRSGTIITAHLGLSDLLFRPEVLRVASLENDSSTGAQKIDAPISQSQPYSTVFFGYPARITPPHRELVGNPALIAALVLRPDRRTLLLSGRHDSHCALFAGGQPIWSPRTLSILEDLIRSHVDQWHPPASLRPGSRGTPRPSTVRPHPGTAGWPARSAAAGTAPWCAAGWR